MKVKDSISPPLTHHCFHSMGSWNLLFLMPTSSLVCAPITLPLLLLLGPQSGLPPTPLVTDAKTISLSMSPRTREFP